jgi:LuxR family transcriptional regulator
MHENTLKVMKNILDATSIQDAWQEMCKFMSEYGFERLMYCRTHFAEGFNLGDEQDYMILSNHDPEYFDFFVRSGRFKRSPFFIWTFTNVGFISWSQLAALQLEDKIKTEALRIVERNQEYGVSAGITASFPNALAGQKSAATICARRGLSQEDVDRLWAEHHEILEVVWTAFDVKVKSLPFPSIEQRLTNRQKEVLSWIAKGKTSRETAEIMNISLPTVEKHVRLAKEALNAHTIAQAVAKLSFLNQLIVDNDSEQRIRDQVT